METLEVQIDGIVFAPEKGFGEKGQLELKTYQQQFFDLLGTRVPIKPLARATLIERLEVPGPGFGIGPLNEGTTPFHRFMQSRFAQDVLPQGCEDL